MGITACVQSKKPIEKYYLKKIIQEPKQNEKAELISLSEQKVVNNYKQIGEQMKEQQQINTIAADKLKSVQSLNNLAKELNTYHKNTKDKLKDKDLLMIIGFTGVGKSLLINYLYGNKLIKDSQQNNYYVQNPQKSTAQVQNIMISQTVQINNFTSENKIEICDSGRILDSNGYEQDIINSYITINTILKAKSIRFLILLAPSQMKGNRGQYLKEFANQFVSLFKNFNDHYNSILLGFNYFEKEDQSQQCINANSFFQEVKEELNRPEEKLFLEMLQKKALNQEHRFVFYPSDVGGHRSHLYKIHKLEGIPQNIIQKGIKMNLSEDAKQKLILNMKINKEVFQEHMKNEEMQLSSDIMFSLSQLNEYIELKEVSEEYKSFLQSFKCQEEKFKNLKQILQSFYQSQTLDQIEINKTINLIIQVIHFYLMIELNKTSFDKYGIFLNNNLSQILLYLNNEIVTNIEREFKNSNDLSFKFLQIFKLSNIFDNKKFQALIQVIKTNLKNDISEIIDYLQNILKSMKESLNEIQLNLSKRIQDIFKNQKIIEIETISILLNDISWIHQNHHHFKELILNDNWLKLGDIQNNFNKIISELEQSIYQINQKQPSDQESISINNNLKKIKEKYDFIKFISQIHVQVQLNITIINKAIENKINQIIEAGQQDLKVEAFIQNQSIISTLINLDQENGNKIKQNQNYITYEQNIDNKFKEQIKNISKKLISSNEEITKQLQVEQSFLDQKYIEQLSNTISQVQSIKEQIRDFQKIGVIAGEYQELENICITIFNSYKNILKDNSVRQLNKIFKKLQIFISLVNLDKRGSSILLKETSMAELIDIFNEFMKFQIEQFKNQNIRSDFNLLQIQYISDKVKIYHEYSQFLHNMKTILIDDIKQFQQLAIAECQKNKSFDAIQVNSKLNFDDLITQQLQLIELEINQLQQNIFNKFISEYKFNLDNMQGLQENNVVQQNIILDILQNLMNVTEKTNFKLFKDNKYEKVKRIVVGQLEKKLQLMVEKRINDKQQKLLEQNKEDLQKFKEDLKGIEKHIPNSLLEEVGNEENMLQARSDQFQEQIATLIKENKFKEVKDILSQNLPQDQKNRVLQQINQKCKSALEATCQELNKFSKNPSVTTQELIITNQQVFNNAIQYFESFINEVKQQLNTQVMLYYQMLIDKIFESHTNNNEIQNSSNLLIILNQFLKDQARIQLVFNINKFNAYFQKKVLEFYQQIIFEVQSRFNKDEDIFVLLNLISVIKNMVQQLNLQILLNEQGIISKYQELKNKFLEYSEKQIRRFLYSLNNIQDEDINSYYDYYIIQIWNFFQIHYEEQYIRKNQFIYTTQREINNIKQIFQKREFEEIYSISREFNFNTFIIQLLKQEIALIKQDIIVKFLPEDDFRNIKKQLEFLKSYTKNYKDVSPPVSDYANTIQKEIIEEIIKKLQFIEDVDFKNIDSILTVITNIAKIIKIFQSKILDNLKEIQNKQSLTISSMNSLLSNYLVEITNSIQNQDSRKFLTTIKQINSITDYNVRFENENCNFINLFEKLIENLNNHQDSSKYKEVIYSFNNMSKFVSDKIIQKQAELLIQQEKLFNENKFLLIIELQKTFSSFYNQIESSNSIKLRGIQKEFIFDEIKQEYESIRQKFIEIKNNFPDPHSLLIIYNSTMNFENYFSEYIFDIQTQCFSKDILISIQDNLKSIISESEFLIAEIENDSSKIKQFTKNLVDISKISEIFPEQEPNITTLLEQAISKYDFDVVEEIQYQLSLSTTGVEIKAKNIQLFSNWEQEEREKKTQGQNSWEYILNNLKLDQKEKFSLQDLKSQCDLYDKEFNATNKQIAEGRLNKIDLTKRILDMAKEFKSQSNYLQNKEIKWNTEQKTQILKILAYLSVVWTFIDMKSKNSSGGKKKTSKRIHSIQILTVMRLLNIDQIKGSKMINQVVQVKTGEGKSIAIGIASTVYALLGFQVDCCCYSAILSERDYNDFKSTFIHFGVESQIQYYTFGKLAEKIVNQEFDLRKQGEAFLNQKSLQLPKDQPKQETNKVLIIDELDFFFGENFFGEVYSVGCEYSNQEIINLFKLIWKKKYRHISIQGVKQSQEYQELFKQHPYLECLKQQIDNKIKQMIIDARQMENHSYVLGPRKNQIENSIGYKELDNIIYDTVKGFKTGFAHLLEWQRQKIPTELMKKKLSLTFSLGSFSYLKMIESYSIILGVTGTLENMSQFQKNQMRNIYKIKKLTYTPSIFGQSKFSFDKSKNTHVFQKKEDYFQKIYDETLQKIQNKRAVIIFFENNQILFEFYEKQLQDKNKDCQILIESSSNKEAIIARASSSGMITLSTKLFGRGIDYKCFSKIVVDNGGIHCIQTFFSKTEAEQIQIQGRVARIGSPGSYCLIILQKHLMEQFNLDERQLPSPNQVVTYESLEKIRNSNLEKTEKNLSVKQQESKEYHQVSLKLKNLLPNAIKNKEEIYKTLKKISVFADSKDIRVGSSDSSDLANNKNEGQIGNQPQGKDENKFIPLGERVQFQNVSVLVGQFCQHHWFLKSDLQTLLQRSLDVVGVKMVKVVYDEQEFINEISNFDQAWIISHEKFKNTSLDIEKRFSQAVLEHLEKKKGLMLLADNDPYLYHANLILKSIPIGYEEQKPVYMNLIGNDRADNQLKKGAYNKKLQFGEHTLTNGLQVIFEGSTICYPKVINEKDEDSYDDFYDIDIIGTSQTSRPCIFALNGNNSRGRIAFDCGFTKMHQDYWYKTPGTEIYFQNCYQWLCNLDNQDN